jgi:hypothetical protein
MKACGMTVPPGFSIMTSTAIKQGEGQDISSWLRSKRLHKYEHCFHGMSWENMLKLQEADLENRGVYTVGARGRFMKFLNELRSQV